VTKINEGITRRLLDDHRPIVVTGAGGWLGRATLEMLDEVLGSAVESRVYAFGSTAREQRLRSGRLLKIAPLTQLADLWKQNALMFHYAYLTKERVGSLGLDEFVAMNTKISSFVEDFICRTNANSIFLPSSGAVYGEIGAIEIDLHRNPYGFLKRRDELRFMQLSEGGFAKAVVCRIFNISGPFINKGGGYALGSILSDILRGGPIVLKSSRPTFRSYVHVRTVVELALLSLLDEGPSPLPFDTAGDEVVEISDLAARATRLLGKPEIVIERPSISSEERADWYVGDGKMFRELIAHYSVANYNLDQQIVATAEFLSA